MPALQDIRRERFAQLVALGTMPLIEAYRQAGYSDKAGSAGHLALTRNPAVASRIDELRTKQQAKTVSGRIKVHHSGSNQNAPPWTTVF